MTKAPARTIQTPGAAPAASAADTGAGAQAGPADTALDDADMDAFTEGDLDAVPASELQAALAETLAMNRKLSARIDALEGKVGGGKPATVVLPTVAEAVKIAHQEIKDGKRPRSTLTDQGWYCHPEMARISASGAKA